MNITNPLLKGTALPGDSVASFITSIGDFTGLYANAEAGASARANAYAILYRVF